MIKLIEKLEDCSPLDWFRRKQLNKINELVDRTNENTRLIQAMPDYPMLPGSMHKADR